MHEVHRSFDNVNLFEQYIDRMREAGHTLKTRLSHADCQSSVDLAFAQIQRALASKAYIKTSDSPNRPSWCVLRSTWRPQLGANAEITLYCLTHSLGTDEALEQNHSFLRSNCLKVGSTLGYDPSGLWGAAAVLLFIGKTA